ncbi:MAG: DNA translocase FtsK 4TM domain-containing protein [Rhizobiaceae bacterium]|nr:DNA translocase FtsK 4TM domain-containing protein [Rhizobiaceae bacterium]
MEFVEPGFSTSRDVDSRSKKASKAPINPGSNAGHLGVLIGLAMIVLVVTAFISLATWSVNDPSLSNANSNTAVNWMGFWGASFADLMIQFFGIAAAIVLFPPAVAGWLKILRQPLGETRKRLLSWALMSILASAALASVAVPQTWPLPSGLGGVVGDLILKIPALFTGAPPSGYLAAIMFIVFGIPALMLAFYAGGLINRRSSADNDLIEENYDDEDFDASLAFGAFTHWYLSLKSRFRKKKTIRPDIGEIDDTPEKINKSVRIFSWLQGKLSKLITPADDGLERYEGGIKNDPEFSDMNMDLSPQYGEQIYQASDQPGFDDTQAESSVLSPQRVQPRAPKPKAGVRVSREAQSSMFEENSFELPSLHLLGEPKNLVSNASQSNEALEQNARLLEGVLEDFGVKGEIINVRPGPVVTLYELEPAPGIKSSRVIGLADDIARSMSAIAARVAVVPGRNAIGIELPNHRRETVYLREALASQVYESSKAKLPIVLGKDIGGEPIIADLAKMPHLLVAGTTGSGKSVAINTMILSILYRLRPDQVKMIMIDPKMLELSIYDGIPHLLTPVVTDPKKAVVALKWTVREMEERYKNMSKLSVRNIDGYNSRLAQAVQKNETITKTVQTGFDRETGEAIYQTETLDLNPMPYIVVIIDEMADLMMVAGKDIEGTVQRLAQMARAAGIHVIMATQRPSVDVITGTIKANFPTRISFQVTSKIDSRTILGEQGAEQLLGMGDMLYMAGGGRITRVHGPFVDDMEVEKIVAHLKTQGTPQYLESVTEDEDEDMNEDGNSGSGGTDGLSDSTDIYDKAVSIVIRDRKVSTSYIQRRLSIGYNRAATLIERMEQEGLISSANHAGKREILVPAEEEMM